MRWIPRKVIAAGCAFTLGTFGGPWPALGQVQGPPRAAEPSPLASGTGDAPLPPAATDPQIAAALAAISPADIQADIAKLVTFGTRSTLSSNSTDLPAGQGILPAADWIESEFKRISAACGNCLEVKRDDFVQPAGTDARSRMTQPTRLVNVYAVLHGTADRKGAEEKVAPWVLVTGHYDSRATDVMDPKAASPGANDDGSGVAVSLECARVLSKLKLPGTIVFATVAGEEQGLYGSRHLAQLAKGDGWPLEAVLNDDIVGGDTTPPMTAHGAAPMTPMAPGQPGALQNKRAVRIFSENVPSSATPQVQQQMLSLGEENDSPSRELAREIAELAPAYFEPGTARPPAHNGVRAMYILRTPAFHPVLILRRDRYLRGGDHTSFNAEGFAAVRFTEWRENFDHQHQTPRTENGVEYGDYLKFVDFDYVANVARMNAMTLASLAEAPSEPQGVKILTTALDNSSELTWEASAFAPPGTTYEVVWRATDETLWTHAQSAGTANRLKLDVSKDNVLFGVRAVSADGQRSLPVPPLPAR